MVNTIYSESLSYDNFSLLCIYIIQSRLIKYQPFRDDSDGKFPPFFNICPRYARWDIQLLIGPSLVPMLLHSGT